MLLILPLAEQTYCTNQQYIVHYIQTESLKTDVMAYALKLAKIMTLYWTDCSRIERKYPFHIITSFFVLFPKTHIIPYPPQVVVSWENWWVDDQYPAGYRNWFVPSAGCAVQQQPSKRHSSFPWKEKREEKQTQTDFQIDPTQKRSPLNRIGTALFPACYEILSAVHSRRPRVVEYGLKVLL